MADWGNLASEVSTTPPPSVWGDKASIVDDSSFTPAMNKIEGTGKNPNSSASGKGQFLDSTWLRTVKKYAPEVAANKTDDEILALKQNDDAFKDKMIGALRGEHDQILTNVLGRKPTDGESYLAWQQGPSAAVALLKNPDAKAIDAVAPFYSSRKLAAQAILNNGGTADMTAGQFAQKWMAKAEPGLFDRIKADFEKRQSNNSQLGADYNAGNITGAEGVYRGMGQGAAFATADIPSELFKSIGSGIKSITPDFIAKPVGRVADNAYTSIANSPVGDLASGAAQAYSQFEQDNPRTAGIIDATANLGNLALSAAPIKGAPAIASPVVAAKSGASALTKLLPAAKQAASKTVSGDWYDIFRGQNLALGTKETTDLTNALSKLEPTGILSKRVWAKTGAAEEVQAIKDAAQAGNLPLNDLLDQRSYLNSQITKAFLAKDDVTAHHLQAVRDAVNDAMLSQKSGAWQIANHEFAKEATMQNLEEMVAKASTKAQPANSLDTALNNFLNSRKSAGLKPDERALLEEVTKQTPMSELKKSAAGRIMTAGATAAGAGIGGPIGAAVGFLTSHYGTAFARDSAMASKLAKLDKVYEAIANRAGPNITSSINGVKIKTVPQNLVKYLGKNGAQTVVDAINSGKALPYDQIKKLPPAVAMQLIK